jgi:aspartyl-tRNA(Asn)/glutamyl-tRNA(Gln) amidotransferase subunit C
MAKLTKSDVLHVADLAKLELSDSEVSKYTSQLSKVIDHISELAKVDTKDVEPTSQTTGLEDVYRKDEIDPERILTQEESTSGSDNVYNSYFKVKAILEGRTDK